VRWEAAKALQRLHDPQVVTGLLAVLRDQEEETRVRMAAADALGQYPQDRVFQALVAALESRHLALNLAAEQSLETLTGQSLGLDSRQWSRWYRTQSPAERFADRQDYYFPTYSRKLSLVERMMFWQPKTFEQPAIPVGLRSRETMRTYDNGDNDNDAQSR
jgi:HEAT repeat protein